MNGTRGNASKFVIGFGIAFATITALSGIAGWVFEKSQVDNSQVTREVFAGIPDLADHGLLHRSVPVLIIYGAVLFSQRIKNWERGQPDNRATTTEERQAAPQGLPGRGLHADPAARSRRRGHALAHLLQLPRPARRSPRSSRSTTSCPTSRSSSTATSTRATRFVGDVAGITFLIGVVWAIVRRYVQRPYRIRIKTKPEHAVILGTCSSLSASPASSPRPSASP